MCKVSVIIPVYRVEGYIAQCALSLLNQTIHDIEFIFINDASPDDSMTILSDIVRRFPKTDSNVKIISHSYNMGLPSARNTGLKEAKGEYIFHCDSDDFVEPTMLEDLYNHAKENNADIVWCDWYLSLAHSERYMPQPSLSSPEEAVRAMLCGTMKFNVWNKLVKRELYINNNITFPDGYGMAEDMTMIMLFANAQTVSHLPKAYYHYVKTNGTAFSQTYSDRHLSELRYNLSRTESYIKAKYGNQMERELSIMKLEAKYPFLLSNNTERLKLWNEWYPEADRFISDQSFSFRRRLPQIFAKRHLYFLVRVYSFLLNRIVYGLIYR